MAAHRYWRLLFADTNDGGGYVSLSEVELFPAPGVPDITSAAIITANGSYPGTSPNNVADDSTGTFWAHNVYSAWLQFDFGAGSGHDVYSFTLRVRNDGFFGQSPKNFTLEYSDNGTSWTTAASPSTQTGWTQNEQRTFTVATYSFTAAAHNVELQAVEAWAGDTGSVRTELATIEALTQGTSDHRTELLAIEAIVQGTSLHRTEIMAVEIIHSLEEAPIEVDVDLTEPRDVVGGGIDLTIGEAITLELDATEPRDVASGNIVLNTDFVYPGITLEVTEPSDIPVIVITNDRQFLEDGEWIRIPYEVKSAYLTCNCIEDGCEFTMPPDKKVFEIGREPRYMVRRNKLRPR